MEKSRVRKLAAVALTGGAACVFATGCGSSNSSGAGTGGSHGPNVQHATQQITRYSAVPKFKPQGSPVNVASLKGKSILNIPTSSQIPFCASVDQHMAAIAKQAGVKFDEFANQGQPSQWANGVTQGINQKVNVISLQCGINPPTLAPQLKQAHAANIKVAVSHFADVSYPTPRQVDSVAASEFNQSARLDVDYAIKQEAGKPVHLLVVTAKEVTPSNGMTAAINAEMQKYCGSSCSITTINVPVSDWATKIQSSVHSALVRNSDINWVIPIYDSMALYTAPGISAAAKAGQVKIATFNGTSSILKLVKSGQVAMDVAENPDWVAHVAMNQIFHLMSGKKLLHAPAGPVRVIDNSNVGQTGPNFDQGFGSAYASGYNKLWGLR